MISDVLLEHSHTLLFTCVCGRLHTTVAQLCSLRDYLAHKFCNVYFLPFTEKVLTAPLSYTAFPPHLGR